MKLQTNQTKRREKNKTNQIFKCAETDGLDTIPPYHMKTLQNVKFNLKFCKWHKVVTDIGKIVTT